MSRSSLGNVTVPGERAKGDEMLSTLRSLVNAILGKVRGKPYRSTPQRGMAMDADFTAKPKAEPKGNSQRDKRSRPLRLTRLRN